MKMIIKFEEHVKLLTNIKKMMRNFKLTNFKLKNSFKLFMFVGGNV